MAVRCPYSWVNHCPPTLWNSHKTPSISSTTSLFLLDESHHPFHSSSRSPEVTGTMVQLSTDLTKSTVANKKPLFLGATTAHLPCGRHNILSIHQRHLFSSDKSHQPFHCSLEVAGHFILMIANHAKGQSRSPLPPRTVRRHPKVSRCLV